MAKKKKEQLQDPIQVEQNVDKTESSEVVKQIEDQEIVTEIEDTKPVMVEEPPTDFKKLYEFSKPPYHKELDVTLPFEDRIVAFLEKKEEQSVRLNEFLKSLYGVPKFGALPVWANQNEMKKLSHILDKMQSQGLISIDGNTHKSLGKSFYSGEDYRQNHYTINDLPIVAKK